ncbi:hypothetical protein HanPI659440_Chr04g0156561 [Helianthus annuus]|nr:hypothetical protein HanPI659440_Chr04g0156561 [Helianthus annuus]
MQSQMMRNTTMNHKLPNLVLKSDRRTKATRSKIEARSAKRKSGGLILPGAQDVYIIFLYIPYISHRFLASFNQNIAINKAFILFYLHVQVKKPKVQLFSAEKRLRPKSPPKKPKNLRLLGASCNYTRR